MIDVSYYKKINGDFHRKVGVIACTERLLDLGIESPNAVGSFRKNLIQELIKFCKLNPKFHMITRIDDRLTVNRYVSGDYIYFIAEGDADPTLELNLPPEAVDHLYAELEHFIRRFGIGF